MLGLGLQGAAGRMGEVEATATRQPRRRCNLGAGTVTQERSLGRGQERPQAASPRYPPSEICYLPDLPHGPLLRAQSPNPGFAPCKS